MCVNIKILRERWIQRISQSARESVRLIKPYNRSGKRKIVRQWAIFAVMLLARETYCRFSGTTVSDSSGFHIRTRISSLFPTLIPFLSRSNLALNGVILEGTSPSKKQPVYLCEANIMCDPFLQYLAKITALL